MKTKNIFDLSAEDFKDNVIWIDVEHAELFYQDTECNHEFEEDMVVEIDSGIYKKKMNDLFEVGHIYMACSTIFSCKKVYSAMACIRAYDLVPYHICLFKSNVAIELPLHKLGITDNSIAGLERLLGLNRNDIYPVELNFNIAAIPIKDKWVGMGQEIIAMA